MKELYCILFFKQEKIYSLTNNKMSVKNFSLKHLKPRQDKEL